jgi:hypothetical protein
MSRYLLEMLKPGNMLYIQFTDIYSTDSPDELHDDSRCLLRCCKLEHISFTYLTRFLAITVYKLKQQLIKTHNMTCHFICVCIYIYTLYTYVDSVTCPSPLKWRTYRSKIKFCFLESLSIQCELFTGTECQSSFYLYPSRSDFIVVPTEPCQVVTLCHKKTQKYL